jgi:hypothetical protein
MSSNGIFRTKDCGAVHLIVLWMLLLYLVLGKESALSRASASRPGFLLPAQELLYDLLILNNDHIYIDY